MTEKEANAGKLDDIWMIRPCDVYLDEFKECKGMRGRFHQLYTVGHKLDCSQWKEDYKNCIAFERSDSAADAEKVIASERLRRKERLASARGNDIWEYRTAPPDSFHKPLPEHMLHNAVPGQPEKTEQTRCSIS